MSAINHAVIAFAGGETALEQLTLNTCIFQIIIATLSLNWNRLKIMLRIFFFMCVQISVFLLCESQKKG